MDKRQGIGHGRVFQPFTIGDRFRIIPPSSDEPLVKGLIHLRMASGAFGSGEHETTAACLELLSDLPSPAGSRVLDLGSGTGILAIAAIMLGADHALCIDNDPDAAESCQRNARLNGVTERITSHLGTLADAPSDRYDLILANIYGDILLAEAGSLVSRARPGTPMILSGILHEQVFDVRKRYERLGCTVKKTLSLGEFCAMLLEKR
jgi:ribosomal protein L11 methyltransferase